jgi:hypothetical protein
MAEDNTIEVFVYTEGSVAPGNVVRVRIDPSVLVIPDGAISQRYKLETIELHDGLREIGPQAFQCCTTLKDIVISSGLRDIGKQAFQECIALNVLQLSDGVESIGIYAFGTCNFTKFRSPPLITTIPHGMLDNCSSMFSLEVPKNIIRMGAYATSGCFSLRNVAFGSNTEVAEKAFQYCWDLLSIFGTQEAIIIALRNRFYRLPVHSKMYYNSYHDRMTAEEILNSIIIGENGELDPSGLQQDCLGMTPLHILACSTVQCLELYQLMIANYPGNLIVTDAWGELPLLYAVWGDAPSEIVHFLVNSYQSLYPEHEFDWDAMVITLCRADASEDVIRNLIDVQQTLSPEYNIDWDQVLGELSDITGTNVSVWTVFPRLNTCVSPETFCFLTRCSIATRVDEIGVKHFRHVMEDEWFGAYFDDFYRQAWRTGDHHFNRQAWRDETLVKLDYYESEYRKLKEMTSLLELSLWKAKIDASNTDQGATMGGGNKELKFDQSEFRQKCRITCGADHVVKNVWPYLLPPDYVRSHVMFIDDNDDDDNDSDDYDSDDYGSYDDDDSGDFEEESL